VRGQVPVYNVTAVSAIKDASSMKMRPPRVTSDAATLMQA
jgi:hypothetical protein